MPVEIYKVPHKTLGSLILGSDLRNAAEVRALDFSDDRLASGLDLLSDDDTWCAFETALNQRTLRVYDLQARRVRLDTASASGSWEVTEDDLFQFGHSKDHRPDLPQVKVMLAPLDTLGMPPAGLSDHDLHRTGHQFCESAVEIKEAGSPSTKPIMPRPACKFALDKPLSSCYG